MEKVVHEAAQQRTSPELHGALWKIEQRIVRHIDDVCMLAANRVEKGAVQPG